MSRGAGGGLHGTMGLKEKIKVDGNTGATHPCAWEGEAKKKREGSFPLFLGGARRGQRNWG